MPQLTFYPLGNADCCLMDLDGGGGKKQKLLFDYADKRDPNLAGDKRANLPGSLKSDLFAAGLDSYDVVAFSHLDEDHIKGAPAFFYLEHNAKYQGRGRIKIKELWVPAAVIIEDKDTCDEDALAIQAEARHRLKEGTGIRVFSGPQRLSDWLQKNGLTPESRADVISDAGTIVPGFTKEANGVEFFVHSPFAKRQDDCDLVNRNDDCLVLHATFLCAGSETRLMLAADVRAEVISDIVQVTRSHKREDRLEWDILKLPHHCSYRSLALSGDKGKNKTTPIPDVAYLFEKKSHSGGIIVCTSAPITAEDTTPPPHFQAANYHKETAASIGGEFKVTMEHPSVSNPEPLVIKIGGTGASIVKRSVVGGGALGGMAPRAGIADA